MGRNLRDEPRVDLMLIAGLVLGLALVSDSMPTGAQSIREQNAKILKPLIGHDILKPVV